MRIDLHYGPQPVPESDRSAQGNSANRGTAASQVQSGEDQTQFSGAHLQVQALASQASQLPEVREERVQSLREAVQSGRYQANPEQVAAALLAHMVSGRTA